MVYIWRHLIDLPDFYVLVPFDIGVVYINVDELVEGLFCFSPLRYWGGLYQKYFQYLMNIWVLVPFDIGVVYIY